MPFIVAHRFIMTHKSSACPTAPPEAKLGTTFKEEAGGFVSSGTTACTPVGLERSVEATGNEVEAGTPEGLSRVMDPPRNAVRAFACVLSAFFEVCRRVSVSLSVSKVSPRAAKRFP